MNEHKDCEKNYRELVDKLGVVLNLPTVKESGMISVEDIRKLVPELIESEDERIRKAMIDFFKHEREEGITVLHYGVNIESMIAWLEKRAEKKTADKVEPKFKVGDVMRTLEEAADGFTDGMPVVVSIDDEDYHCTNERIAIKDQDKYEYPPMNRKQESAEWSEEDER